MAGDEKEPERPQWPSEIAEQNRLKIREAKEDHAWMDWVKQQKKDNQSDDESSDQNQQARGRSLPDEQRQQKPDRGHSR